MAEIVAGLGCSHAPSIAHVYDQQRTTEPEWQPLFRSFDIARDWIVDQKPDAMVVIYNDHIDQFFLDAWPTFAIGTGPEFPIADEGWGPRDFPPVPGHPGLATHIANEMVAGGVDLTVCHQQVVDHGILSPLPLIDQGWAFPIVPIAFNVIWDPRPSPRRAWEFGEKLGDAIRSFPGGRVVVVGTGGLSHHLTGPTFGQIDPDWDLEFLRLIDEQPESLVDYSLDDFAKLGGEHSVEVIQWMAMRAALGPSRIDFKYYYPYMVMGYGVAGFLPQ